MEIAQFLDKFVVGQQEAKKVLSIGVYQHYRQGKREFLIIYASSRRLSCNTYRTKAQTHQSVVNTIAGIPSSIYHHTNTHSEYQTGKKYQNR